MARAGTIEVLLTGDMAGLEAALKRSEKRLEAFGSRMQSIGTRLSLTVTAPLTLMGAASIRSSVQFEQAMAGVAKTVDAPAEKIAQLAKRFTELSERIPVAREVLAGIAEEGGQLGIATNNLEDFVRTVADLKVSTNLGDQAATVLARLANVTGTAQTEFARLGATIVDLGNNGASTEAEISDMALRIGGAGKLVRLTAADVLGISNALASLGVESEAGGTAVQRVLLAINTAVATGSKQVGIFARASGMSAEQFAAAWKSNPREAFVSFVEGLGRAGDKATTILSDLGLEEARLTRAFLTLGGAGDMLRESIARGNTAWAENTALTKEAERFYNTSAGKLQILKNRVSNLAGEFGDVLVPAMLSMMEVAQPLFDKLQLLIGAFAAAPAPLRAAAVGALAFLAAVGPIAVIVGGAASVLSILAGAATAALAALTSLAGVIATGGFLLTSIASFGDAIAAGSLALSGMASLLNPGALLLVGLGLLAAALLKVKLNALTAAAETERSLQRIRDAVAKMNEDQARDAVTRGTPALQMAIRQRDEIKRQIAEEEARVKDAIKPRPNDRTETFSVDTSKLTELQARETALTAQINLQKEAVVEAAKQWDQLARARIKAEGEKPETPLDYTPQTEAEKRAERLKQIREDLATSLQVAEGMELRLGEAYDENAARASAYRSALEGLLAEGIEPGSAEIIQLAENLQTAEAAMRALKDAEDALKDAEREKNALIQQGVSLYQQSLTPLQVHAQALEALRAALDAGRLSQEQYNQAVARVNEELDKTTRKLSDTLRAAGERAGESLIRGIISGAHNTRDLLKSFLVDLATTVIMSTIKTKLGIHSPSRVFYGYGQQIGAGLMLGMQSMERAVSGSALSMARAAMLPPLGAPALSPGMAPAYAGAVQGAALLDIDPSKLPRPLTPFEAARDNLWMELFSGSVSEHKSRGGRF